MPILPALLALLAISPSINAGIIGAPRVARQADAAATVASESAASNEGLHLLQIFQDQSISRAGIKQRVSSWASDNQFADLVAAFEDSVRQRTLARREQAKEAAVELPKALDTISEIEDDMLLTPSETYSKVNQTLNEFSPKLRSLVLTAMEPTPLDNSTTPLRDVPSTESSGDLPVEVVEGSGVEGSGVDVEGSGANVEGSGSDSVVEGSGADDALRLYIEGSGNEVEGSGIEERPLELRSLLLRSANAVEGSGVEGSGLEGSGEVEGSGIAPLSVFPMLQLRDDPATSTDSSLLTPSSTTASPSTTTTIPSSTTTVLLPPIKVVIDVYDDTASTMPSSGVNVAPWGANVAQTH